MQKLQLVSLVGLLVVIALAGCATTGSGSQSPGTPPTHPQTDFDGDGIVDWQDDDDDNDGHSDADELEAGSDPRDPESVPSAQSSSLYHVVFITSDQTNSYLIRPATPPVPVAAV